jgi:ribose transport system substrate-binding protein
VHSSFLRRPLPAIALAVLLAGCSGSASPSAPPVSAQPSAAASTAATAPLADCAKGQTTGPNGEVGVPTAQITLTADEIQKVKDGKFKAAILWHTSSNWVNAVGRGIKDTFASLGVTIVSESDAEFDAAKQASQVETVMALNPDIIITLVVDPVAGAQAYRKVIDAGKKLVLISNVPKGYVAGKDYVGVVSDDFFGIGTAAADLMGKALNGTGAVGYIFHDASYYVTNQRDQAFKQGLADPSKGEDIASAMLTQHTDITGIYAPWDQPAEGVVSAIRAAGKSAVKVVTIDLGANNDLDMAQGGNVFGKAVDLPYVLGQAVATEGAYGVLGKAAPAFAMVPTIEVTKSNLAEGYQKSFHIDAPADILKALGK